MEPVLIATYAEMLKAARTSVRWNRILEDPEFRGDFLGRVRASAVDRTEFDILRTLHNLRKRSKLPRRDEDKSA